MARRLSNWLEEYVRYASVSEAPGIFHFWAGVSAVAGALRRKVWFDQVKFRWYPSFYVVLVAPPGVATKSTTADGSMDLLRGVPGIKFGPDEVTWQQLVVSFANANESFLVGDEWHPMSPITIVSSEFGMLMDFKDAKMVNLFITLWDGRKQFEKETKTSGSETVEAPWINMIACTTPQWISGNMDANTIGGGFTSRCIFVYAEKKARPVAYIRRQIDFDYGGLRADLIHDLEVIATALAGEYSLTPEAEAWGEAWYERLWTVEYQSENEDYVNGYLSRKQAHLHKLAIVLAASVRNDLVIEKRDLEKANVMLNVTEEHFAKVFSRIGRSDDSVQTEKFLDFVRAKGEVKYSEAYRYVQTYFTNHKAFEGILAGLVRAGYIKTAVIPGDLMLVWIGPSAPSSPR